MRGPNPCAPKCLLSPHYPLAVKVRIDENQFHNTLFCKAYFLLPDLTACVYCHSGFRKAQGSPCPASSFQGWRGLQRKLDIRRISLLMRASQPRPYMPKADRGRLEAKNRSRKPAPDSAMRPQVFFCFVHLGFRAGVIIFQVSGNRVRTDG